MQTGESPPRDQAATGFSDAAVKQAIQKGANYLWSRRNGDGSWEGFGGGERGYPAGPSALCAYALLASGVSPNDKRMAQTLEWLSKQKSEMTYTLGLRCNAWYLANKETAGKYMKYFKEDLSRLIKSTKNGGYNYFSRADGQSDGDNSNSQYGVLGTWAGQMANQEIPEQYWKLVLGHWRRRQSDDGGWGYGGPGDNSATMTAGGIASIFVCFDTLFADQFIQCDAYNEYLPIKKGLDWMDKHFLQALQGNSLMGHGDLYYFLYGIERVGLASGYKYFGTADWYKLGATRLIQQQNGDGSWPRGNRTPLVSTAFALLFLVRGQHPIAFNKLEFDGDWNNRPRDMAGLTRWLSDAFEGTLNWQIINLKVAVEEWHDAPILYLSGCREPKFSDKDLEKLQRFVWEGGTIFSVTECSGSGFSNGIRAVYKKLFPSDGLRRVSRDHDLYTIHHKLAGWPAFFEINNGIRPLVIHADDDLPKAWQLQMRQTAAKDFEAAANVLMYVTDRGLLRNRGVSHWPPEPKTSAKTTIRLARLQHPGRWDPEPLAYERFRRLMALRENVKVEIVGPVEITQLPASGARIATLTGTDKLVVTNEDKAALKSFVAAGGTLIIDAAGGSPLFGESAEVILHEMFGRRAVRALSSGAEIYRIAGHEIPKVAYRRKARVALGRIQTPNLRGVEINGRIGVIFSKEDLTGGLVGYPSYACMGYMPSSAYELMRNALLYGAKVGGRAVAGK